ncbi:ThiF family adenylyltransferase [uncultured Schumannella sp.]|uniref:ThiF family adenylyltransferase n=1 Tax=uncultured Schumannella sp. TaxID=1195956 RepID=UPI0025CF6FB1|nr:ThiF family adenylyltransferase [uncultured Schumannella sp.]
MTGGKKPRAIEWQRAFADDVQRVARERPAAVRVIERRAVGDDGYLRVLISMPTEELTSAEGGLALQAQEQFFIVIPPQPFVPPNVEVDHRRFAGFPHVLAGSRVCIYLDPNSEWDPRGGAAALLERLWAWLGDAAAGAFDAQTALYHAVGGVTQPLEGASTLVVRRELPEHHAMAYAYERSNRRLDLAPDDSAGGTALPIWYSPDSLPYGVSSDLRDLARLLDDPNLIRGGQPEGASAPKINGLLTTLKAAADRNPDHTEQLFLIAVAHPRGGPPHLLAGALGSTVADSLRKADGQTLPVNLPLPIAWQRVSDERPSVTTRRDATRPVRRLVGTSVFLWGCGGLGSWAAEFLVRAGVSRLVICDPGTVTGGLLVRQDFEEMDIGEEKAVALAARLRKLRDDVVIEVEEGYNPDDLEHIAANFDLIIDATANLAVSRAVSAIASQRRAIVAQIATDRESGYLGIATIWPPIASKTIEQIDAEVGERVRADPALECYHMLWGRGELGNKLIPTRGCSIPTFHGSAADLAAVAGSLLSLVAGHLETPVAGVHLIALPHSGLPVPPHLFFKVKPSID